MSTLEAIMEDLKALPSPKLEEAAHYIHRLRTEHKSRSALERSFTILSEEEGAELEKIIEEGCEKVDARDW